MYFQIKSIRFDVNSITLSNNKICQDNHRLLKVYFKVMRIDLFRSSYKEHIVDALALGADEGRDKLRKATVSRT